MEEEEISLSVRNSRKMYVPAYLMIIFLGLVFLFLKINEYDINNTALVLAGFFSILILLSTETHRLKRKYEITPYSAVKIEGYLNKVAKRIDLLAISDVEISQSWWKRLLNFGSVHIHLFSLESKTQIDNINKPVFFVNILEQKMAERRKGGSVSRNT